MHTLREILQHFLRRLRETPLLLGWLLLGPLVALLTKGWIGFVFGLINILLLGIYAILIRWMTPNPPSAPPVKRPHLELAAALALFALFLLTHLYIIGILVNALPEELFFRGMLLPRLEEALGNSLNALVVSALLFNALHVPIEIYNGASPLAALLSVFSIGYPSGLIWGYLYLRTRSILPGIFWHTANGNLGFLMMSA